MDQILSIVLISLTSGFVGGVIGWVVILLVLAYIDDGRK